MFAGPCVGAAPASGCQYTGWTPAWLPTAAEWTAWISGMLATPDENLCPRCVVDRARRIGVGGFNNQKVNRVKTTIANTWHCVNFVGVAGHTHLPEFGSERFDRSRSEPPGQTERSA